MQPALVTAFAAPFIAFVVALLVTVILRSQLASRFALDPPNERSLHSHPVPRTGGLGVLAGLSLGAVLLPEFRSLLWWLAPFVLISLLDDVRGIPAALRLAVHLVVATVFALRFLELDWPIALLLGVAIAWMTNLFNFMDGADGLAGGMAVIGFAAYGFAAIAADMQALSLLAFSIVAAAAGFLIFNFPPAKIFMGDVGSIPLGFLAGALGVAGWQQGLWPLWFPPVVFAPFIADASMTLTRRLLRGERIGQAHREHYYQRLILSGWSHRKTAIWEYALMLACAALALAGREAVAPMQAAAVVVAIAACAGCAVWIDRCWAHHQG